ncbi:hypothetical protein Golomagni_06545, partial [Golovinomyces magnicellulatus]
MQASEPIEETDSSSDNVSVNDTTQEAQAAAEAAKAIIAEKTTAILEVCSRRDIASLQELAQSAGGLLSDKLRQLAWPILLGVSTDGDSNADDGSWKELPRHRDEDQVQLDVNRAFIYYPHDLTDTELATRKTELSNLISEVLRRYPFLCYFQGFHDICQVLLLALAPKLRASAVARLSVLRIRDFMLPNLGPTTAQLRLLPDILCKADAELWKHVVSIEPFYALAGTLTMYAHNIEAYNEIARLFDILLAQEPVFSIYMFAQIVVDRREEIFEIDEPDLLQVVLSRVPPKMNLDGLISRSTELFEKYPPETLRSWRQISSSSALKTAHDVKQAAQQTMAEGEEHFVKQSKEL